MALLRSTHSCIARLVGLLLYNVAEYAIAATGHSSDAAEVALLLGRLLLSPCDGAVDAGCAESAVIEDVIDGLVSTSIDSKDDSSSSSSSSSDEWIVYELLAAPMTAMAAPAAQVRVYTAYAYARLAYEQRGLRGITSVGRQLRRSLAAALAARRLVGQALLQRLAGCSEASSSGGGSGREGSAVKVAEFAVACMHEEMQRLQDRAIWDSVARNMMQVRPAKRYALSTFQSTTHICTLTRPSFLLIVRIPLHCCPLDPRPLELTPPSTSRPPLQTLMRYGGSCSTSCCCTHWATTSVGYSGVCLHRAALRRRRGVTISRCDSTTSAL